MYETTINYQTYSQQVTGFDGEGQLTSAINYVISEDMPVLYTLTGHEELSMSESMKETIQKSNIEIRDLNLLTEETVPEDTACLFIFSPKTDIAAEEAEKIIGYLENGGKAIIVSLNLLTEETVPEDTACLFIFSPKTDIAAEEAEKIIGYLENGGKAIIVSDYTDIEMPNFNSVLENYGVQPENGIVLEGDEEHYIAQNQYYLLPNIESNEITSNLSSKSKYILTALSPSIKSLENVRDTIKIDSILTTSDSAYENNEITSNLSSKSKYILTALSPSIKSLENVRDTIKIDSILTTSDSAYEKTDLANMETTEKEEGDLEGPFPLAVSITEELGEDKKTQIAYFASSAIFSDQMNATVSGANYELLSSSLSWLCGTEEDNSISIPSKAYDMTTLMIPASDVSFWVSGANYELLSSSLSWLCGTEEDNSISIPSKAYDMTTLMIPASDVSFWSIFVTAVVPVGILLVGFGIWLKRRKQ